MKRVSIKGIAIGIFCDLFLSLILGIGLTIAFVDSSLINQPPERLESALLKLSNSYLYLITCLVLGIMVTVFGGYIAARIAKQAQYINSGLVGLAGIIIGIFMADGLPLWYSIISSLSIIPAALLGGYFARVSHSPQLTAFGRG